MQRRLAGELPCNRDIVCPGRDANCLYQSTRIAALEIRTRCTDLRGLNVLNNNSPLESLAAFAIVFATGILSTVALGKYIEKVRRDAQNAASGAA
jgi:hypothetical protein